MLRVDPCIVRSMLSYFCSLGYCVSPHFRHRDCRLQYVARWLYRYSAVKTLRHLKLRDAPFCGVLRILYVAAIRDAFICWMPIVQIYYDGMIPSCFVTLWAFRLRRGVILVIVPTSMFSTSSRAVTLASIMFVRPSSVINTLRVINQPLKTLTLP